jgi:hypothetical protein
MEKMGLIGILGILILAVAISGCTSSSGNTTYTYGKVSFLIPSDMKNATQGSDIISGDKNWQEIAFMGNGDVTIRFQKYNGTISASQVIYATELGIKQNNGNVTSTTNTTNPNGVVVAGATTTLSDPNGKDILTYHDMSFTSKGVTYILSIYGTNTQTVLDTYNMVYNSLKIA